jgi:hypothetical protein
MGLATAVTLNQVLNQHKKFLGVCRRLSKSGQVILTVKAA